MAIRWVKAAKPDAAVMSLAAQMTNTATSCSLTEFQGAGRGPGSAFLLHTDGDQLYREFVKIPLNDAHFGTAYTHQRLKHCFLTPNETHSLVIFNLSYTYTTFQILRHIAWNAESCSYRHVCSEHR